MDTFTISALADELKTTIIGGRIQDVIDVDALGIGLEIYADRKRHYLYLSADAMHPRLHLVAAKLRRGLAKPTQLGLLLRRFAEGGLVTQVLQPAWERLLEIEIEGRDGQFRLIAELMPRRANLLLCARRHDSRLLESRRTAGESLSSKLAQSRICRRLRRYAVNSTPQSFVGSGLHRNLLGERGERNRPKRSRLLPGRILGMSPLLAREIVFRATGDLANARAAARRWLRRLYAAFREVLTPLLQRRWQPGHRQPRRVRRKQSASTPWPTWNGANRKRSARRSRAISAQLRVVDAYMEAKKPVKAAHRRH